MDILIESTKSFEKDISKLGKNERTITIKKINECTSLFLNDKSVMYRKLRRIHPWLVMSRYDLSLYALRVMRKFIVILTIDEDPIFGQVIFTLFRVVKHDDFAKACQDIAQSLYQQVVHDDLDIAQVS